MANIIIHGDERREYGIAPCRASSLQREMADCIAQKTNEAYSEARKVGTI